MKSFSLFSALTGTSLTPGRRAFLTGTLLLTSTGLICRVLGFFYRIFMSRTVGAEGLVVVETPDAVMVCPRSKAQDVKKIVDALKERNRTDKL